MIAVADSSPLITLAKLDCFHFLHLIFTRVYISTEVYREVVVSATGRPGAAEVEKADWIESKTLQDTAGLLAAQETSAMGLGELSTIFLAKEIRADCALIDDLAAHRLGKIEGLKVLGVAGLLEAFYLDGHLADLRTSFRQLLAHSYIDQRILDRRLRALGLAPL